MILCADVPMKKGLDRATGRRNAAARRLYFSILKGTIEIILVCAVDVCFYIIFSCVWHLV